MTRLTRDPIDPQTQLTRPDLPVLPHLDIYMVLIPLQKLGGDSPLMSISTSHSQETKCVQSIKTMLLN